VALAVWPSARRRVDLRPEPLRGRDRLSRHLHIVADASKFRWIRCSR
jgi:hypothetical protein